MVPFLLRRPPAYHQAPWRAAARATPRAPSTPTRRCRTAARLLVNPATPSVLTSTRLPPCHATPRRRWRYALDPVPGRRRPAPPARRPGARPRAGARTRPGGPHPAPPPGGGGPPEIRCTHLGCDPKNEVKPHNSESAQLTRGSVLPVALQVVNEAIGDLPGPTSLEHTPEDAPVARPRTSGRFHTAARQADPAYTLPVRILTILQTIRKLSTHAPQF